MCRFAIHRASKTFDILIRILSRSHLGAYTHTAYINCGFWPSCLFPLFATRAALEASPPSFAWESSSRPQLILGDIGNFPSSNPGPFQSGIFFAQRRDKTRIRSVSPSKTSLKKDERGGKPPRRCYSCFSRFILFFDGGFMSARSFELL